MQSAAESDQGRRAPPERVAVTIGVICAIPQEWAYLRSVLSGADREQIAQITFDTGELDAHRVVLVAAGMGKVNTGLVATLLADRFHCHTIVFTGVAGGLDPRLHIGDSVVADRVVQHDFGVIEDERLAPYQPGHVPFINPTERFGYPVDPDLIDRVKRHLAGADSGADFNLFVEEVAISSARVLLHLLPVLS